MSKIVMVHGAGNDLWGPASIKSRWYPALADGLAWHGVEIDAADVCVAFYGDVFRGDPQRGYEPPIDLQAAVASIGDLAREIDPQIDLAELTKLLTENHYDRLLAQAGAYLQEPTIRTRARQRLEAVIGTDTEVVVAHSLGTIVTYETLCAHPEWTIDTLVTIGCPLGGPLIHERLDPAPVDGVGAWPGSVRHWVNISDAADPAAQHHLVGQFDGPLVEYAVDNGHRVHDPEPYLNNPWTGGAIAGGLRA
jgi:pimeloyl-ACP methyl ester carboxylesterase